MCLQNNCFKRTEWSSFLCGFEIVGALWQEVNSQYSHRVLIVYSERNKNIKCHYIQVSKPVHSIVERLNTFAIILLM